MEFVLVKEFVEGGTFLVVFFVLLLHDLDVFDEADQELLHSFSLDAELLNLCYCSLELYLPEVSLDHKVSLVPRESRGGVEPLFHFHVLELGLDVLFREHENMEFL